MKSTSSPVMELTPAKFLALFLFLSVTGWILFTFAARLAAWMLSRMIGGEVRFRFGGLNCLKDITLNFKKGALESLVMGEVRVRTCRPSLDSHGIELGRTAMLQVLFCDAELVLRKPSKKTPAKKHHPKKHLSGRGKWMILANIMKYVSLSVVELVIQVPNWTLEVKELDLGMDSEESGLSLLGARLVVTACSIYDREQTAYLEHTLSFGQRLLSVGGLGTSVEGTAASCYIEQLSISSTFAHTREQGVTIKQIDVMFGETFLDINEELLSKLELPRSRADTKASSSSLHPREVVDQQAVRNASGGHFLANAPEKASLNLPKVLVKFSHKEKIPPIENEIIGVLLACTKMEQMDDLGGSLSQLDIHLDSGEIHLLRDGDKSFVEIMKTAVIASMEIPKQTDVLPQAEIDVKLGGVQCSLLTCKLEKWLDTLYSLKPRTQKSDTMSKQKVRTSKKGFNWTCTISAPDMSVSLHDMDGINLFNVSLQTSHIFFNSALKQDIEIHTELGELCIYMVEEKCTLYKGLFGMDTNSGCLLQMARITVDFGVIDNETATSNNRNTKKAVLAAECTGTSIHLTQPRLQSLLTSVIGLIFHSRKFLVKHRTPRPSKSSDVQPGKKRKIQEVKLSIEGLSVQYCSHMHVVDTYVPDPKKVNFGCEGGEVVMEENNDGKLRTASIKAASYRGFEGSSLLCKFVLAIARLQLQIDHSQNDIQVNLQRVKALYQELGSDSKPLCEIPMLTLQNAKVIYRLGVVGNGIPGCYIRISDLKGRWEPDIHLFAFDAFLHLKVYYQKQKHLFYPAKGMRKGSISLPPIVSESGEGSSNPKNVGKSVTVAIDMEHINFSAALADGVEASLSVASMFSEDFKVGILLEELKVLLNGAAVLKSKRLQLARIPCFTENDIEKPVAQESLKHRTEIARCWDYLIQGSGVCVVLPYRLECRAIDDAVEDTWRGLKIAMLAQRIAITGSGSMPLSRRKPKGLSSSVGVVKFLFENITAEIEEEPFQGWFDEHHQLMSKSKLELDIRERLLYESILEGDKADVMELDAYAIQLKLQQQNFQSYRALCHKLQPYESSGSSRSSFQMRFRPSINRGSLFSIKASILEVVLSDIEGGRTGMIEQIRKLDCVPADSEIPYSRVLGKRVLISTSSLVVRLRNYNLPMLSATGGKCNGQLIFARQATCFPKQILQELYVGRWRKLTMFRSESGTTPPFKMFSELPIEFEKAEAAFGVGFEPALADVSYAFTVALRRANLSVHDLSESHVGGANFYGAPLSVTSSSISLQTVKKERNLPWWDDMRYYVHGHNSILSTEFKLFLLATTNPYEDSDSMKIEAELMDIQQQEGSLSFVARGFRLGTSSMECSMACQASKSIPTNQNQGSIQSPFFKLDITMGWDCETANPLFHYLHAFPHELITREKVYDPFRSTSLILRWNFRLTDVPIVESSAGLSGNTFRWDNLHRTPTCKPTKASSTRKEANPDSFFDIPTMSLGGHDLMWIFRWWSVLYSPPHKLRTFSKWPRFAVARSPRSGNLSLDKVMTDFMLRVDSTPAQIRHISLIQDDPAEGLTFDMKRFKYELCYSRGKQRYTFACKRDILELVYQGLDLHMLKADLRSKSRLLRSTKCEIGVPRFADDPPQGTNSINDTTGNGFFFTSDYFSLRKQAPKADLSRLSLWQEEARRPSNPKSLKFTTGSGSDPTRSDPSDDDGFNIVMPDNCLHVSLYGLKLLWAIYTRDAVWAWVENLYRAFETPKPSPSRQYAQRKIMEEYNKLSESDNGAQEGVSLHCNKGASCSPSPSRQDTPQFHTSPLTRSASPTGPEEQEEAEEGTMHFMVNVVQPQFNLQSEEARGRFLLAAASGKVMARSFRSIMNVGPEMIAQAVRSGGDHFSGNIPELTWSRRELSVLLEQVQAHVAPTDVDPGAGLQWLPRIPSGSQKVKRTGALLERVFLPCAMYFQYTRCKSEDSDVKVKALKELSFNSSNITAIMTSRQFQVMVDIISNLLLARLPKPRRYFSLHGGDEEEDAEEETDEVVPDGVREVELARIKLEETERALKLLSADLKAVNQGFSALIDETAEGRKQIEPWMMHCGKGALESRMHEDWNIKLKARKLAARSLRIALQRAAQQRFKEKEKTKSIPSAMRISWAIDKIVWSMLFDGQMFAEAEISNMNLNVDRDFHEVGIAQFTAKHFVVKNCLPHAKSNTVLSAWNPPTEWARNFMLRVDARQGAPKEGNSPLELFQVEIFPLRIHLTERMYRMMWDYFFPKEDHDTQRRQVWKASTTAVVKRGKKMTSGGIDVPMSSASKREHVPAKASSTLPSILPLGIQPQLNGEEWQSIDFRLTAQILEKDLKIASTRGAKLSGLQRSSSFDAIKEENPYALDTLQNTDTSLAVSLSRNLHCAQSEQVETAQPSTTGPPDNMLLKVRDSSRANRSHKLSRDDKKLVKSNSQDEKKSSTHGHTNLELHNIKISQVELLVTYEGSRLSVNELRLLMDTFTRVEFRGTWRRFFSRVKKHIIWSVLKSVAGMQGKKFKDKLQSQGQVDGGGYPGDESSSSDSDGSNVGAYEQFFPSKFRRPTDRAGERFVSSIRGLFNSQRRKAKAIVLRTKRADSEATEGGWTEGEADNAPFTRQSSISKARRLLRRHTKKFLSSTRHRGSILFKEQSPGSSLIQSEGSSDDSSCYEEIELVDT